jgi:Zn-dependent M16 (insulinase) family peptidase
MAKLDTKKIENALKSLENAAKGAVRALNEMTDNEFKGSNLEIEPLGHIGMIVRVLQNAQQKASANARFEGKTPEEISELQEQERQEELATIQQKFQDRLAARAVKPEPEPEPETETGDGSDGNPDDSNKEETPQ